MHSLHITCIITTALAMISLCTGSECSSKDFESYQHTCKNLTVSSTMNNTIWLETIENCFPWIPHNFPQCWQVVQNISKTECQQTCQYFQYHCPMLDLFDSTKCSGSCSVGTEKMQLNSDLLSSNCSQVCILFKFIVKL